MNEIFSFNVKGLTKLQRSLNKLGPQIKKAAEISVRQSCELIRRRAVRNITKGRPEWEPFKAKRRPSTFGLWDTGKLAGSMETTYISRGDTYSGIVYSTLDYAPHQELGTRGPHRVPGRPYLRPAYDESKDRIGKIIQEEFDKAMRGFVGV